MPPRERPTPDFPEPTAAIGSELGLTENGARMRYLRALPKLADKVGQLRRDGIRKAMQA